MKYLFASRLSVMTMASLIIGEDVVYRPLADDPAERDCVSRHWANLYLET